MPQLRALLYARVSTEDQVEKYGLPAQLRACREYAIANDYQIVEEVSDEGISGATMERAGLERLRQLVRSGVCDVVVTLDPDRLSRVLIDLLIIKTEIDRRARLAFVTGSFENTPNGELFFELKGSIAKYERAVIRDRMMRGKRERAKSGKRVGGREPYGYRDDDGLLVVSEPRAATAREIFSWYDSGLSMREITRRLRGVGAPTWGGGVWWNSAVRSILKNEVYTGVARWGAERIEMSVPPLVSREQWARVQARLAENPHVGRPSSHYLLRGLLYCACGRRMYGEATKSSSKDRHRIGYYRCRGRSQMLPDTNLCPSTVNAAKLDAAAWSAVTSRLTDAGFLRSVLEEHEDQLRSADPGRVEQLEIQARKLRGREAVALELMSDPDLAADRAVTKRQYLDAQRERTRIEAEIAGLRRVTSIRAGSWIEETADVVRRFVATVEAPDERQRWMRKFLTRAEWTGEELQMACFIGPESSNALQPNDRFPALEVILTTRLAA